MNNKTLPRVGWSANCDGQQIRVIIREDQSLRVEKLYGFDAMGQEAWADCGNDSFGALMPWICQNLVALSERAESQLREIHELEEQVRILEDEKLEDMPQNR